MFSVSMRSWKISEILSTFSCNNTIYYGWQFRKMFTDQLRWPWSENIYTQQHFQCALVAMREGLSKLHFSSPILFTFFLLTFSLSIESWHTQESIYQSKCIKELNFQLSQATNLWWLGRIFNPQQFCVRKISLWSLQYAFWVSADQKKCHEIF